MEKDKKKKHNIEISEYQRKFLLTLVMKYTKETEKKGFPTSVEVDSLEKILLKD